MTTPQDESIFIFSCIRLVSSEACDMPNDRADCATDDTCVQVMAPCCCCLNYDPAASQKCSRGSCVGMSKQRTAPCAPQQRGVKMEGRNSLRKQHNLSKLNSKATMLCYNPTLPLPLCSSSFWPSISFIFLSTSLSLSSLLSLVDDGCNERASERAYDYSYVYCYHL